MRKFVSIVVAGSLLTIAGCGSDEKSHRGLEYMPDMYESPAYKSQQVMEIVINGEGQPVVLPVMTDPASVKPETGTIHYVPAMMPPPAGTVSRHFVAYPYGVLDTASANKLANPLLPTADVLREGQKRFHISCAPCHGNDGDTLNGYVAHKFTGIPSLNSPTIPFMTDGDIYHIITMGRNRMPNYRAQLLPEQRWSVVHYVRLLNRSWKANGDAEVAFKAAADAYAKDPTNDDLKRDFTNAQVAFETAKKDLETIQTGEADWKSFVPKPEPKPEYVKPAWPEN